ncbi:MAG: hypothetical protein NTY35_05225 [Planctomycetota bacterium]|nr:hypothetical protein [Planctomycetota bacterium]
MNATKVLLLPALLLPLPLLLGSNAPATRVAFAVAEGKSLTKTFEVKADLSLEDMTMGGAAGGMVPDMEMTMGVAYKVGVTDDYVKVEGGAPKKLKRTFDSLSSDVATSMKMEIMGQSRDQDSNVSAASELEGKSVLFTWDAEKKEYKRAFDPTGGEEKLLEGLREDMDLRALLPSGEVKEGEEWEIEPKALVDVLAPGGNLALKPKEGGEAAGMGMGSSGMENMAEMFGDDLEGKSKAQFTGMREVDGVQMAVVKLTIAMKAKTDMTERVREQMKKGDLPPEVEGMEFESVDIEYALEAEGELLWNVGGGHFHSLDLSGTTSFKSAQSMAIKVQGRDMKIDQSMEFSGTTTLLASAK